MPFHRRRPSFKRCAIRLATAAVVSLRAAVGCHTFPSASLMVSLSGLLLRRAAPALADNLGSQKLHFAEDQAVLVDHGDRLFRAKVRPGQRVGVASGN